MAQERRVNAPLTTKVADVRTNLDYLVIGTLVSPNWANSSYGRKVEKAFSVATFQ